ncbi:MAG: aminopeptidase P family protein, partial [Anaerolineae bacterium]|nr:aminopeptidase P family protein [Anaerolineae bacterium]
MTRVQTLLDIAKSAGLDAVALIPGAHLQYLTGLDFHLSERPLVIFFTLTQEPVAIAPALEADRLAGCGFPIQIFPWSDTEGYQGAFAAALDALQLDGKQLGIEELRMRVLEANTIQTYAPGAQIVSAGKTLAALRMHKDDAAIASMRQAIQISQDALEALIPQIKPGMTEREVAGLLVVEQLKRGGGKHPFEPIVLSGPRSALPHGEPGDRQIALGEPLLFDFGTT